MKKLIIYILLLTSLEVTANTVKNVGDTTLTSNWDAGGAILNITGKISGPYTISNANIQANLFIQIFDTTVTLGTGINCDKFSTMWYGAKSSNTDNYKQLQMSIDACKDRQYSLFIPAGSYTYSKALWVSDYDSVNAVYLQTSIKIHGTASFWDNGGGSELIYTGNDNALNIQLNKGSEVSNLIITGKWVSPSTADSVYYNTVDSMYANQASAGNGNGIYIDQIGTSNHRSGSTGCYFHDLKIQNFCTLIHISNSVSQNGEIMVFDRIQLGDAKYGVMSSQPQEKTNSFTHIFSWGRIYCLFNITSGANYYIDGVNVAGGCVQLFNIAPTAWFPTHVQNVYAENIGRVGAFSTSIPISVSNSVFDFIYASTVGHLTLLTSNSNKVKFDNCLFRYYGATDSLNFSGSATFENCVFSGTIYGTTGCIFNSYSNGTMTTQGTKVISILTDTILSTPVKLTLRKSYLNK